MNYTDFYFTLETPRCSFDDSTVGTMYSSPEKDNEMTISINNTSYKVIGWGENNQLPYDLKEKVEKKRRRVLAEEEVPNLAGSINGDDDSAGAS